MKQSPKDKAEELVYKFMDTRISWKQSKLCALIAIDEIIKAIPDASDDDSPYNHELLWWQELKNEIQNL